MRKIIVAGNWKMNHCYNEARAFVNELLPKLSTIDTSKLEMLIAPSFLFVENMKEMTKDSSLQIGSQDVSSQDKGAFTGEVSAQMLSSINCDFSIIGHSERRQYHQESDALIREKLLKLFEYKIRPIVCLGESLEEREQGITQKVILQQLKGCFKEVDLVEHPEVIIAYEPIWAIGTGKTATPEMAEEVHSMIREWLTSEYGKTCAQAIHILYGGSMNPGNIQALVSQTNIDGGLIGGASLKVSSYFEMIEIANKL